ncbi:hypothetical protein LBMAG53_05100 [Planctomycetota bacterium]|nr:hypothetical protein LBMAG53_05100 [Planctomycetota bacterium]
MSRPVLILFAGLGCLVAAQVLWFVALKPLRPVVPATAEAGAGLPPGEFAGTLLLGGFRGLACDLLWMRAVGAKESGRHYESVALAETIAAVQPRFSQVWEFLAHDLAYNLAYEAEDRGAKFAWFRAGIAANVQGCLRNPGNERILRNLAWMFNHKGDDFHTEIDAAAWGGQLDPVIAGANALIPAHRRVDPLGARTGLSNFAIAARLYALAVALAEATAYDQPHIIPRMVPLAWEFDGNVLLGQGRHREALGSWIASIAAWQEIAERAARATGLSKSLIEESYQRNEGRLRRRAADLARRLASDPAAGEALASAIDQRHLAEAKALLAQAGWKDHQAGTTIRWLDEGGTL